MGALVELNQNVFKLRPDGYYLVNPSSVGQPRDGDPRASFLIFDTDAGTIGFRRVAYDLAACRRKARQAGLLGNESAARRCRQRIARSLQTAMERVMRA